jgi:hypothetical protein
MGEVRNVYKILVGIPEGNRALGRLGYRWKDNIEMELRKSVWGGVNWIHLAQDKDQW